MKFVLPPDHQARYERDLAEASPLEMALARVLQMAAFREDPKRAGQTVDTPAPMYLTLARAFSDRAWEGHGTLMACVAAVWDTYS